MNIETAVPETAPPRAQARDKRILVVDDEPGLRDLLTFELEAQGYQVVTARDGEEALELVRRQHFHLIISDVKMPRRDGLDLLQAVKAESPDTEMLLTTGYGTVQMAIAAMRRGAYDFVEKPYDLDTVLALIEKALEKNELTATMALYQASQAVFAALRLEDLVRLINQLVVKALGADDSSIMLTAEDGSLRLVASQRLPEEIRRSVRQPLGEGFAGRVARWKEPLVLNGPLTDDPRFAGLTLRPEIRASIVCPLMTRDRVLGVLCINRIGRVEPYTAEDSRMAMVFVSLVSQAIENSLVHEDLLGKIGELERTQTELGEVRSQLIMADRLSALGQLTAGVAHELNNPLTVMIGNAELIEQSEVLSARALQLIFRVKEQGLRCRNIVRDLLSFSRRQEQARTTASLNDAVTETVRLVEYELRSSGITFELALADDVPNVFLDVSRFQQVLVNLITNARDALAGRPVPQIVIRTERVAAGARLTCADNGPGISAHTIAKVFDPFFSTKAPGKGTGLGLSVSYGIVQDHGGTIRAESGPGEGTSFIIDLPAAPAAGAGPT